MKKKFLMITTLVFTLLLSNMNMISAYTAVSTGDDTNMTPYIILLVAAVVVIIGLFIFKKRKK